jgi:hypothetical protein
VSQSQRDIEFVMGPDVIAMSAEVKRRVDELWKQAGM